MKWLLPIIALLMVGCGNSGTAQKLQSHISSAQTSTATTGQKVRSVKSHLDTVDYKGSRALDLLNKGQNQ